MSDHFPTPPDACHPGTNSIGEILAETISCNKKVVFGLRTATFQTKLFLCLCFGVNVTVWARLTCLSTCTQDRRFSWRSDPSDWCWSIPVVLKSQGVNGRERDLLSAEDATRGHSVNQIRRGLLVAQAPASMGAEQCQASMLGEPCCQAEIEQCMCI